jgi:hypothetical protein
MVTKPMEFSPFQDILEPSDTQKAIRAYIHLSYPTAIPLLESDPSMFLETTCDNHSFPIFHRMIYELIQFWAKTNVAKYYPFYEIWETWEGVISSASHFRAIQHWMQIITLQDYMDAVRQCPYIADNVVMEWDQNRQCIKWKAKHHPKQTAFEIPQSYRNVVNKVNLTEPDIQLAQASQQDSSPQDAQPFMSSDAFRALLNDFQDEDESEGTIHTNRFIHFLQDKMGSWDIGVIKSRMLSSASTPILQSSIHLFKTWKTDLCKFVICIRPPSRRPMKKLPLSTPKSASTWPVCRNVLILVYHVSVKRLDALTDNFPALVPTI